MSKPVALEVVPSAPLLAPTAPAGTTLAKLARKVANNLDGGVGPFVRKSLRFAASTARAKVQLRACAHLGVGVRIDGHAPKLNEPAGDIWLGDDVGLSSPVTPTYFDLQPNAHLTLGSQCWVNDGVWFGCTERITIGARVLIGPGVRIFDNEYHGLYERRRQPVSRPVTIEDDVWIAADAIVLPGVTIGRGAVIGAHSVVVEDVAAFTVVAGNPARVVKVLDPARFARAG